MSEKSFAKILAAQVPAWETFIAGDGLPGFRTRPDIEIAEAFLATPQMQAIKKALLGAKELPLDVFEWAFCE